MGTTDESVSFEAYPYARNAALSRIAYLLTGDHHLAEDLFDRFGGPPPSLPARLLDWLGPLSDEIALLAGIAAAIYAVRLVRRRIRTGSWRRFPGGTRRRVEFPRRF